jgi:uncharacterized protein
MKVVILLSILLLGMRVAHAAQDYPIVPVPFTKVTVHNGFWKTRLDTNRNVTLPYDFEKCEETNRIRNFEIAGGLKEGEFEGIFFNDSDVFKVCEGAAYCLALEPDPELETYMDNLIAIFAAAQEDDGYLYTNRTIDPENPQKSAGRERWSHLMHSHELYNAGHMYEAAVAWYEATGKRNFLEIAIKNADLIDSVFGPDGLHDIPGHEEIEIGLCRLYRATGEKRYLDLAKFFIDQRGNKTSRDELYGEYVQDHKPVLEQAEAVGHAVRAGYLYSGMADVAALTGDKAYIAAIGRIWENVVTKKMYITGGIGSTRQGEAFGKNYELPNATAYNETCAAIANALWNHRMFLLHGDAKYIDVLERVLYNGFLAGISLEGNTFFYPNPLEADGRTPFNHGSCERQPWFGCSCCPVNIVRFIPAISGYVYGRKDNAVYVNLYMAGEAEIDVNGALLRLRQETDYPWDGTVTLHAEPEKPVDCRLMLRIPGWAQGEPVPGDLYRYQEELEPRLRLEVNGENIPIKTEKGYAPVARTWEKGDTIRLVMDMPVRRVLCKDEVEANRNRVALERGPVVFCAEGADNEGGVFSRWLPDGAAVTAAFKPDLLGGVMTLSAASRARERAENGGIVERDAPLKFVPYAVWNHRGVSEMQVWIARNADTARPAPAPNLASRSRASASHARNGDSLSALSDGMEPESSGDQNIPRFTWWDHKGTVEWVQYEFAEPAEVTAAEVYWFDDTGRGACRVPAWWKLYYRKNGTWEEAPGAGECGTAKDRYNRVEFEPVMTDALRITARLQPDFSGGILEWTVEEK